MKKNILEYETFVHYGCSFTFGQDSGGDDIHDDKLSYPAHLSRIIGNNYINNGYPGSSVSAMYYKLFMDLNDKDIYNNDAVYIINLTSMYRYSMLHQTRRKEINKKSNSEWPQGEFKYDEKVYYIENYIPSGISDVNVDMTSIFSQDDIYFLLEMTKCISAIHDLLINNNKPHVFLDMHLNYNLFFKNFKNHIGDLIIDKQKKSFCSGIGKEHRSISKHFYSSGYEKLATNVYDELKHHDNKMNM